MNEFHLIDQFFKSLPRIRQDVVLGIGDDAASVRVEAGMELLVSTDTLVSGVHFLPDWNPYDIAVRSMMVNISDMAAMGAEPCWVTLALTLPEIHSPWLSEFASGLRDSLETYQIDLIGGDTTRGPLAITITILGQAPVNKAIKRSGARAGDLIVVTGALGGAALAVQDLPQPFLETEDRQTLMDSLLRPKPRVEWRSILRNYASSAIDISDGLSADLHHICHASGVGASLSRTSIPLHPLLPVYLKEKAVDLALTGGDDYELCFTVSPNHLEALTNDTEQSGLRAYPIGVIENASGIHLVLEDGRRTTYQPKGYSHF